MDDKKKPSRKPDWTLHQMLIIVLCLQGAAAFFQSVGMPTTLTAYGIDPDEAAERVQARFDAHRWSFGEHSDITGEDAAAILRLSR